MSDMNPESVEFTPLGDVKLPRPPLTDYSGKGSRPANAFSSSPLPVPEVESPGDSTPGGHLKAYGGRAKYLFDGWTD